MQIDYVHDLQEVYRKILHSMSRPGTISTLKIDSEQQDHHLPCNHATFLTMLALLDAEVSFHVVSEEHHNLANQLAEYTLARHASIDEADYVLVLRGTKESEIADAIKKCKIGTLLDPQTSATWILENNSMITNEKKFILTGPGVQHEVNLHLDWNKHLLQERNERVKEYPLGIDLVFTDDYSHIACIPRTTTVVMEGM
ncbi:phosphonate C-P lyase system protein PhnH [Oceanobacillus salinisoli]|uniref:phosphonate C-P lyase system protein PhnH n=1 Tax=Oceanobacillus salinisoli TaxID=2678611 RepID=UPI0012E2D593|nr:phosphonate C-P lyase system protein PhnH [Oceanobacillus salinisoli]